MERELNPELYERFNKPENVRKMLRSFGYMVVSPHSAGSSHATSTPTIARSGYQTPSEPATADSPFSALMMLRTCSSERDRDNVDSQSFTRKHARSTSLSLPVSRAVTRSVSGTLARVPPIFSVVGNGGSSSCESASSYASTPRSKINVVESPSTEREIFVLELEDDPQIQSRLLLSYSAVKDNINSAESIQDKAAQYITALSVSSIKGSSSSDALNGNNVGDCGINRGELEVTPGRS